MFTINVISYFKQGTTFTKVQHGDFGEFESPDDARKKLISRGWSFYNNMVLSEESGYYLQWNFQLEIEGVKYFARIIEFSKPKQLTELPSKA